MPTMYNNQSIRKKHSALTLGRKDTDTSFILFPVRLETRFVNDHPVEDVSEPDKVLYVFQTLWEYADLLAAKNPDKLLQGTIRLMRTVESLDAVYREDKRRLINLLGFITRKAGFQGELKMYWDRITTHVSRLTTLDVLSSNEATEFLRNLERVNRTIIRMRDNPPYNGHKRPHPLSQYPAAFYRAARKNLASCFPVLEQLLPGDSSKTIVNRFTYITRFQYDKFIKSLSFLDINMATLERIYQTKAVLAGPRRKTAEQIKAGLKQDLRRYDDYLTRYWGGVDYGGREVSSRKRSIQAKMAAKVGIYYRYTYLAARLIGWRLRNVFGKNTPVTLDSIRKWRKFADHTVFRFDEERDWLISLLNKFNDAQGGNDALKVSVGRLNRNTKAIKKRKLSRSVKKKCLLVRVYPDEVAVTQLAKPVSREEAKHVLSFWASYFYHDGDELQQKAAFKSLCSLYTAPRATFIARNFFSVQQSFTLTGIKVQVDSQKSRLSLDEIIREFEDRLSGTGLNSPAHPDQFPVPMSLLMPDRFVLQAQLDNGKRKSPTLVRYGHLIPETIQVGIDLNRKPEFSENALGVKFRDNLRWMTDYDEAERMGMAITLPLDSLRGERPIAFKSIYVMGIKDLNPDNRQDSDECSALLARLFNAHLYSEEGLDLLKIGTPTNILTDEDLKQTDLGRDARSSEFDTNPDVRQEQFFKNNIQPFSRAVPAPLKHSDAGDLSGLFGFDSLPAADNPFANVAGRENWEVRKTRLVREQFLEILSGSHPILGAIARTPRLRHYFLDAVSPVGVFAPFRIGSQPYGIVPVCDFKNLQYGAADPLEMMRTLLLMLADHWNAIAAGKVLSEENMHADEALSSEQNYLQAVSATPVSKTFYRRKALKELDLLSPNYFKGKKQGVYPFTDLYKRLSRFAPMKSQDDFIKEFLPSFGFIPLKEQAYAAELEKFTWGSLKEAIRKKVAGKAEFRGVSDAEIEELITATFDLFNYRLDAWLTGLLGQRIFQRMKNKYHKIALGAYGWVFNLREDPAEPPSEEFIVAPSINHAITASVLRSSYVRASEGKKKDYSLSVNLSSIRVRQALRIIHGIRNGLSLGAILGSDLERLLHEDHKRFRGMEMEFFIYYLRKAYPLNDTTTQYGKAKDRDHSLDVLNGVALLEDLRGVKTVGRNKKQLTELYASGARWREDWLKRLFREPDMKQIEKLLGYDPGNRLSHQRFEEQIDRLFYLIQRMEDSYDALADVVTSESVYQLTQGNRVAVDALMNSMNTGRSFPEPEVTEIPLDCAHIEQRVFAALNPAAQPSDDLLSRADPAMDQWLGEMLGTRKFLYEYVDAQTDQAVAVPIGAEHESLHLSPSEIVYLSGDWEKFGQFLRLSSWVRVILGGEVPSNSAGINLEEARMAVDSMREMLSRARPLKQEDLIARAIPPKEEAVCVRELQARYQGVVDGLIGLGASVMRTRELMDRFARSSPHSPFPAEISRKALSLLLECYRIGFTDALSGVDESLFQEAEAIEKMRFEHPVAFVELLRRQKGLADMLGRHETMIQERLTKAETILKEAKENSDSSAEAVPKAMKALLCASFVMVPHFEIQDNETIDVAALNDQCEYRECVGVGYFNNVSRAGLEDNLIGLADVRPALAALHQVRMFGKWNYLPAARQVEALQLEARKPVDKVWMGAAVENEESVRDAHVYTVLNSSDLIVRRDGRCRPVAGLLIDYWAERIPYRRQTAGLAFSYDQPDAEPPQAVLVGVSTLGSKHHWSQKRMLRTIRSAMYQVKSRAVEPEHLYEDPWTSALFPAISIDPNNPTQ